MKIIEKPTLCLNASAVNEVFLSRNLNAGAIFGILLLSMLSNRRILPRNTDLLSEFRGGKSSMYGRYTRLRTLILASVISLGFPLLIGASEATTLTKEQIKEFLLNAKIVSGKQTVKGITNPWRLTLSDGTLTHDAGFQAIDEHKARKELTGGVEINFVDSYKYNIAAYILAEMLGVDDLLPVYVERKYRGELGSLSWWLPVKMDEGDRLKKKISAPDSDAWNKQMYKIRVFDTLVYDSDANLTNVLIGEDWQIWRVDFSRAFRLSKDLQNNKDLVQCDRQLFEKLKTLNEAEVTQKTKAYLTKLEIQGVMARRDKVIAYFQKLIADKGESQVLY
jgi:hypothetical protein